MIMSMLATNKSPIDPNNFPLASLIAQEKDKVDVNFLNRNNFNNKAYRNNFGSNNYKPYPPNNANSYGNSYGGYFNPNKNVSSDLENVLKEFITSQKAFNKSVEEKLEKLDSLVLLMMLRF